MNFKIYVNFWGKYQKKIKLSDKCADLFEI